eukprot:2701900-Amphidinium_carterae.1
MSIALFEHRMLRLDLVSLALCRPCAEGRVRNPEGALVRKVIRRDSSTPPLLFEWGMPLKQEH